MTTTPSPPHDLHDEKALTEYFAIPWRYRAFIVVATLASGLVVFLATRLSPPAYEATASIVLDVSRQQPVEESVVQFLELFRAGMVDRLTAEPALAGSVEPADAARIQESLRMEPVPGTRIVRVRLAWHDPEAAPRLVNGVARLAASEFGESLHQPLRDRYEQVTERLAQATARMEERSNELVEFRQQTRLDLLRADYDALIAERSRLPSLRAQIQAEKASLAALERTLAREPDTTTVSDTDAPQSGGGIPVNPAYGDLASDVARSRAHLASLESAYQHVLAGAGRFPAPDSLYKAESELKALEASYDAAVTLRDYLAEEEWDLRLAVSAVPDLTVVEAGSPSPIPRRTVRNVALALVVGFWLAIFIVFLMQFLSKAAPAARAV